MLTIRVLTYKGAAPADAPAFDFDVSGGTLGRSPGNQLILPDPEKHISRIHARVVCHGGRFAIIDLGSANRTQLNGRLLDQGVAEPLSGGDLLTIGDFVLGVSEFRGPARVSQAPAKAEPTPAEPLPPVPEAPQPEADEPDSFSLYDHSMDGLTSLGPTEPEPQVPQSDDVLLGAFLRGLGQSDLKLPHGLDEATMEKIGMLLRESVDGTLKLLTARFMAKFEVGAEVTVMAGKDNNPLKFSPDAASALQMLLAPVGHGFLDPEKAIRGAFNDLLSHLAGSEAGLRAALEGVLAGFAPAKLEERLSDKNLLDSLLPMNRRAKLWDLFSERYQELSKEAESDFRVLFDRAYLRAYEDAVHRARDGQ